MQGGVSWALQKQGQGLPLAPLAGHPMKRSEPKAALSPIQGETSQPGAVETSGIASHSLSPSPSWPHPREKPTALVRSAQPCTPWVAGTPGAPKGQEDVPTAKAIPAFRGASKLSATQAWIYTRWPFAACRGSGPLAGSEMIPSPPALLLNQIHLASTTDVCYSRSLSERSWD